MNQARTLIYVSHMISLHDRPYLQVAKTFFQKVHLVTFYGKPFPSWLSDFTSIEVIDLWEEGRAYDDPDEERYRSLVDRWSIQWSLWKYKEKFNDLMRKMNPSILHGTWVPTDGYLCARAGVHPLIITPLVTDIVQKPKVSKRLHQIVHETLRKADRVIVDCQWAKAQVLQRYPDFSSDKCEVIPRPVDLTIFSPALRALKSSAYVPILVCNRHFEDLYDHQTLFSALDLLPRDLNYQLLLTGSGVLEPVLQARANQSPWRDRVKFMGRLKNASEVAELVKSSDIYITSSKQDGTSSSLIEAMACGLPSIVTNVGGNPEWIEEGKTGFLFPVGDVSLLAEHLKTLILNSTLRLDMGKAARKIVEERAHPSRFQEAVIKVYGQLLSKPK